MNLEQARQIATATEWEGDPRVNFTTAISAAKCLLREYDELQHQFLSNAADMKRFAKLVAEMRHAQREFVRTTSRTAGKEMTRLEQQVDAVCREVINGRQGTLFG